jgi:hypothetical protein
MIRGPGGYWQNPRSLGSPEPGHRTTVLTVLPGLRVNRNCPGFRQLQHYLFLMCRNWRASTLPADDATATMDP